MNRLSSLSVYKDIDFDDAADIDVRQAWAEACEAENRIAAQLANMPLGTLLLNENQDGGWMLWPHDEQEQLVVFYIPSLDPAYDGEVQSRCDVGLDWVDIEESSLLEYAGRCRQAVDNWVSTPAQYHTLELMLDENSDVLMKVLDGMRQELPAGQRGDEAKGNNWICRRALQEAVGEQFTAQAREVVLHGFWEGGCMPLRDAADAAEQIRRTLVKAHELWERIPADTKFISEAGREHGVKLGDDLRRALSSTNMLQAWLAKGRDASNEAGDLAP